MGTKPVNNTRISKHIDEEKDDTKSLKQQAYEVTSLPNWINAKSFQELGYQQHAGELPLSNDTNYFFWLIHNKKPKGKLLIWLNGGPGCSSTDGLILERGVFDIKRTKGQLELSAREEGWHSFTNIMAVDQPVGTGYSVSPSQNYAKSLEEVAIKFDEFLTKFFELFPEYSSDEIYLGGESFAGIWIPTFANYTLLRPEATKINLKGLLIGNGWIDPKNQYPSILPMLEKYDLLPKEKMTEFQKHYKDCMELLKGEVHTSLIEKCEDMVKKVSELSIKTDESGDETCINNYDFRLRDGYPGCGMGWPPTINEFYEYMKKKDVISALHARPYHGDWEECSGNVYSNLNMTEVGPTIDLFPGLLNKLNILLFGGEYDFMVNNIGIEYLVGNLTKHKATEKNRLKVNDPEEGVWLNWGSDPKLTSGQLVKHGSIIQATIYNASHMSSYDQPISTGSLLRWFTSNRPSSELVPEPKGAPGFFFISKNITKPEPNPIPSPIPPLDSGHSDSPQQDIPSSTEDSSPTYTMWAGVLVALTVLGCLVVGLVRSRHRNPFRPDHQELLADEENELETTRFGEASPVVQERNSGDDYAFEFQDNDDDYEEPTRHDRS